MLAPEVMETPASVGSHESVASGHPTLIHPDEALRLVVEAAAPLPSRTVAIVEACGLRLAEEVRADRPYPPIPRVMMDGFAVLVSDAGTTVRRVGELAAGQSPEGLPPLARGLALEVMTGATLPPGAEAVVPKEHVRRSGDQVLLPKIIAPGANVAEAGSECAADRVVLRPGEVLTPLGVAALASFGRETVRVTPRPTIAVITTGAELLPPGGSIAPHQIRDSNGPMLLAAIGRSGHVPTLRLRADDRPEAIRDALERSADRDVVLLTGGVSAGRYDLVPQVLEDFGAEVVFHKVRQRPGKPLLLARKGRQLFFGLPGNPLACYLGFFRYAAAALRTLAGGSPGPASSHGRLSAPISYRGRRTFYCLAHATRSASSEWSIAPLGGVSAADLFTPHAANCVVALPEALDGFPEGTRVAFDWLETLAPSTEPNG